MHPININSIMIKNGPQFAYHFKVNFTQFNFFFGVQKGHNLPAMGCKKYAAMKTENCSKQSEEISKVIEKDSPPGKAWN